VRGIVPGYARPIVGIRLYRLELNEPKGAHMPLYETVVIARSEITQAQADAVADAVTAQLETDGGAVKKREYWGLRSLAYRIKKNRKGHYILLGLEAPSPAVVEMERQLKLNEDVLRFMTIRIDEISEEPSVILSRKSDDRDRGFRGPKPAGRFEAGRKRGYDEREEFRARDEFRTDREEYGVEEEI
jgi:small subunit ribosomal protein S6